MALSPVTMSPGCPLLQNTLVCCVCVADALSRWPAHCSSCMIIVLLNSLTVLCTADTKKLGQTNKHRSSYYRYTEQGMKKNKRCASCYFIVLMENVIFCVSTDDCCTLDLSEFAQMLSITVLWLLRMNCAFVIADAGCITRWVFSLNPSLHSSPASLLLPAGEADEIHL